MATFARTGKDRCENSIKVVSRAETWDLSMMMFVGDYLAAIIADTEYTEYALFDLESINHCQTHTYLALQCSTVI